MVKKESKKCISTKDKTNLRAQKNKLTDGAIAHSGDVIDILFYMTYMNDQIPKL